MDQNATDASPDFIGGLPPPPGVILDLIDPPKNVGLIVVVFLGLILTTVCVWIRVWTKVRITKKVEWEDCKQRHAFFVRELMLRLFRCFFCSLGKTFYILIWSEITDTIRWDV